MYSFITVCYAHSLFNENCVDPDQPSRSSAFDLDLHCLPTDLWRSWGERFPTKMVQGTEFKNKQNKYYNSGSATIKNRLLPIPRNSDPHTEHVAKRLAK